jgi:hypothetical protein
MPDAVMSRISRDFHEPLFWFAKRGYLRALCAGDKQTWDAFVVAAAPLVSAAVHCVLAANGLGDHLLPDAVQHVFVRLSANGCRLLKEYDPARATIASWLAVTSWSSTSAFVRGGAEPVTGSGRQSNENLAVTAE